MTRADLVEQYRERVAAAEDRCMALIAQGGVPPLTNEVCLTDGSVFSLSATVRPDEPWGFLRPWFSFSRDSRDAELYEIAEQAASRVAAASRL